MMYLIEHNDGKQYIASQDKLAFHLTACKGKLIKPLFSLPRVPTICSKREVSQIIKYYETKIKDHSELVREYRLNLKKFKEAIKC